MELSEPPWPAGLNLPYDSLEGFRAEFLAFAREALREDQLRPVLEVSAAVDDGLSDETWYAHELLQPFGIGNPQPLLCLPGVSPADEPRILKDKHRLLRLRHRGQVLRAVYFNGAAVALPAPPRDVAFYLETNEYQGRLEPQIQVEAIRRAEPWS